MAERGGTARLHPGQQAPLSPALSAEGDSSPAGRGRGWQGPLPVRDGHRHRQDPDRRQVFGLIPRFKSKDELLEEEFAKFVADTKPEEATAIPAIKTYFKAYVTSGRVREIIDSRQFTDLATNPVFSTRDFKAVPPKYRTLVPEYVKDYVSLNQFAA